MKRVKRMAAALLAACLVVSLLPVEAGATAVEGKTITVADGGDLATAVETANNGDTIELSGTGNVNVLSGSSGGSTDEPWFINKSVTIIGKGSNAQVYLRRGGIVLGADVTFKDLQMNFVSNVRNAIMANGYTLTLDDVICSNHSFNLFCGGFENSNNEVFSGAIPTRGAAGTINIKGNTTLQHTDTYGKGNIYAGNLCMGGMNAQHNGIYDNGRANEFTGNATIVIDGPATRSDIGTIYGCGGQQRIPVNEASGKMTLPDMNNYTVKGKVSVTFRGPSEERDFTIWGLSELNVETGNLTLLADNSFRDNAAVSVASGASLNIKALNDVTIGNFTGGGSLVLWAIQNLHTLTISGTVTGETAVYTGNMQQTSQESWTKEGHVYIKTPASTSETAFELKPYTAQSDIKLVMDGLGNWKVPEKAGEDSKLINLNPENVYDVNSGATEANIPLNPTYTGEGLYLDKIPLTINVNGSEATPSGSNSSEYTVSDLLLCVGEPYDEDGNSLGLGECLMVYSTAVSDPEPSDSTDPTEPIESPKLPDGAYPIEITVPGAYTQSGDDISVSFTLVVGNTATPIPIAVPTANTGLKWTGEEQVGVNEGEGYTLTGTVKETAAGNYSATATLKEGYQWVGDATGSQTILWSIAKADAPAAPSGLTGIAPTTANRADGKITGTTTAMEYATKANFSDKNPCTANETTGLTAGTYYIRLKETDTHKAGAYATVVVPAANVMIPIPTAKSGLKWTGEEQVGVNEGEGYTLTDHKATNAGDYTATATLTSTSGYQWSDRTTAPQTIKWSIAKADAPAAPSNLIGHNSGKIIGTTTAMEYATDANFTNAQDCTGNEITGLAPGTYYVRIKETRNQFAGQSTPVTVPATDQPNTVTVPAAKTDLKWTGEELTGVPEGTGYTLTGHKATNAGDYEATATLTSGYQWADKTATPKTIPWTIAKGEAPAAPTGLRGTAPTSAGGTNGKITGTETTMQYASKADFTDATDCAAGETTGLASGSYYVRLKETNNHPAGLAAEVTVPAYSGGSSSGGGSTGGSGSTGGGDTQEPVTTPQQTANAINAANNGSTVTMTLSGGNTVSRTVWQALAGKDVTLEIETGRFTWSVDGRDVDSKALPTSLNLGAKEGMDLIPASVLEQTPRGTETLQISLNHNGAFAVPLALSVDLGRDNAQRWANLYYYNPTAKTMEFQSASLIGDNGRAAFSMDHASSYAVVVDRVSHGSEGGDDPFLDVSLGAWYYDVVRYVYQKGIMTGTGRDTFSPLDLTTRGQAVATLYRMAGSPTPGGTVSFQDVAAGSYYEDAVRWAVEKGVATGHSADRFAPDAPITREQLAALLCRYARIVEGESGNASAQVLGRFPDQGRVSAYAVQPLSWAVEKGLIDGFQDGSLQPQGLANRAQMAAVLSRFAER